MSPIAGLDSPLERGTGTFDWTIQLEYVVLEHGTGISELVGHAVH